MNKANASDVEAADLKGKRETTVALKCPYLDSGRLTRALAQVHYCSASHKHD